MERCLACEAGGVATRGALPRKQKFTIHKDHKGHKDGTRVGR